MRRDFFRQIIDLRRQLMGQSNDMRRELTGRVGDLSHDVYVLYSHVADLQDEVASLRHDMSDRGRGRGGEGNRGGDGEAGHPPLWRDEDLESWLFPQTRVGKVADEGRTDEVAPVAEEGRTEVLVEEVVVKEGEMTPAVTEGKKFAVDVPQYVVGKRLRMSSQYVVSPYTAKAKRRNFVDGAVSNMFREVDHTKWKAFETE